MVEGVGTLALIIPFCGCLVDLDVVWVLHYGTNLWWNTETFLCKLEKVCVSAESDCGCHIWMVYLGADPI